MEYDPELIEAVAAAIVNNGNRHCSIADPWHEQPEHIRRSVRAAAEAALEALENYLAGVK